MDIIKGVYTSAKLFTTKNTATAIDDYAVAQLQMICDNKTAKDSIIRIMPDVHPGKVGTVGLTMTVGDKLMPNLIGIDIGCGMTLAQIKGKKPEFQRLDTLIRDNIPSGFAIRKKPHHQAENFDFSILRCAKHIQKDKALLSLGTLGGGNHFLEVDMDAEKDLYVVIHSGSRHLGKEVTEHYLREGQKELSAKGIEIPYELTYLEGQLLKDYLFDLQIVQEFATLNRSIILDEVLKGMKWKIIDCYTSIYNYMDCSESTIETFGTPVLRKGVISAKEGEKVIIPINMRDGIILGTGLGNKDWNCSAPHGAGRIAKREDIKANFTLSAYKKEMKGIYSSCINKYTLDEAPFAYRKLDEIAEVIQDTVTINNIIKPVYNYKAGGN